MFAYYSSPSMFGAYPFEKYGMVPGYYGFPWGGMENQTLVMIHTQWLRSGDDAGMAHEMSHMWYGDMVTCVDYGNIWLNEGFGTYAECNYVGHANGRSQFRSYINGKGRAAISQDRSRRFPIFNPPEAEIYNYGTIYCKGAWVQHTLRWVMGDTAWEQPGVFFAALRAYGDSFRYGTASTDDYCRINEQVSGQELTWFFDEWIYQAGYPKYHLDWAGEATGDSFRVITSLAQTNGSGAPSYFRTPLPVRFNGLPGNNLFVIRPGANPEVDTFTVAECPDSLTIDPDNWILDSSYVVRTGVAEQPQATSLKQQAHPTVVRNILPLPKSPRLRVSASLLDASGRRVMALVPGPNDLRALPPGVYFALQLPGGDGETPEVQRIIVVR
jgi:aminopeptidase N